MFFPVFFLCISQIHETVETINQLKIQREFMLGFARDPQHFISEWLVSQNMDLKVCVHLTIEGWRNYIGSVCFAHNWILITR